METTDLIIDKQVRAKLYKKIAAVTAEADRIPKRGTNTYFKYAYALEGDVTDALRELLAKHGLAVLPPTVLHWERDAADAKGNCLTRVQYQFGLGDCETGETLETIWWGESQDNADKSFGKAATSAVKYWLLKSFLLSTGDDPDDPDAGPSEPVQRPAPATAAPRQAAPAANTPKCPTHPTRTPRQKEWQGKQYYSCTGKMPDESWCNWQVPVSTTPTIGAPAGAQPVNTPVNGATAPEQAPAAPETAQASEPDRAAVTFAAIDRIEAAGSLAEIAIIKADLRQRGGLNQEQAAEIGLAFQRQEADLSLIDPAF